MTLPSRMTVIAIKAPGGPEMLVPQEQDVTLPGPGEILVKVAAAGVNRPDVRQRQGTYPPPKGATEIPGLEIAGEVAAIGDGVKRWKVGDKVCALVVGGGYAQYCLAFENHALPVPPSLSMVEAAAMPETFFTCWQNMFMRADVKNGDWVLVHGGTSGIGTTAIMLAKAFGATVIVTAGSPAKCEACRRLGADLAIDYRAGDWLPAVLEATGGRGVDLVLDMVGGPYIAKNYEAAMIEGRIVQIAFLQGAKVEVDFTRLMMKRLTHTGSTMRAQPVSSKARIARALEDRVWPVLSAGHCLPALHATFPLEEAAAAHRAMEEGQHIGKIVLAVA